MLTQEAFFARIDAALRKADHRFDPKESTDSGWNVYQSPKRGRYVMITVNYVQDERVSVKLTIQRDVQHGPTPVFDCVHEQYKTKEGNLKGRVCWTWDSRRGEKGQNESRIEVETRNRSLSPAQYEAWVIENATEFLSWAVFSDSC